MASPTMEVKNYNLPRQARDLTHGSNRDLTDLSNLDPNLIRKPDYFVYVFSVADRDFEISRPTLNISRFTAKHNLAALREKDAYELIWRVPSPYPLPFVDQNTGEVRLNTVNGERAAMDICNPNQKSTDMDGYIAPDAEYLIGLGDNLVAKGLFFVSNNPELPAEKRCTFVDKDGNPCEEGKKDAKGVLIAYPVPPAAEVRKAYERKVKYYNYVMDRCKSLEYSSQVDLDDYVKSEPDVHIACEFFGVETKFHQVRVQKAVPVECPICGSDMKRGAAFHPLPGSKLGVCVNDWNAAIEAGVVDESDRPGKKKKQEPVTSA